jgi:hypothetical protein
MKNTTKVAIAGLLSAAGAVLNALAAEYSGGEAQPEAEAPKVKRGKATAAAATTPAAETAETATDVAAEPEAAAEGEGKTYDELRALIAPVVKDGQGQEVKKIIKKYAGEGGSLKTLEAKHHAAFEKDIAALSY